MNTKEIRGRIIFNITEKNMYLISDSYIKNNIGFKNERLIKHLSESENFCFFLDRNRSLFTDERVPHYWTLNTDGKWLWSADLDYYTINYGLKWPLEFLEYLEKNNCNRTTISDEEYKEIGEFLEEIRFDYGEDIGVVKHKI
ncbi:hypothetical protein [Aquimarina rhabdastrellae]